MKDLFALRVPGGKVVLEGDESIYFDLRAESAEREWRPADQVAPERRAELKRRIAGERAVAGRLRWDEPGAVELGAATKARPRGLGYLKTEEPLE